MNFQNLRKKTVMALVYEFSKIYKKRRDQPQYMNFQKSTKKDGSGFII